MKKTPFFLHNPTGLHRNVLQYHPRIGQLYVPNVRARIPNEMGGYYVTANSLGFRSNHEFPAKRQGRPRILFFGDSFTAGFGVDNEQRFSELAGATLGAEVYNYGVTGTGTDQQLLIYEEYARKVEADLLVFCVLVENIERNLSTHHRTIDRYTGEYTYVPKPYFQLEGNELTLCHSPVPLTRPSEPPETLRTSGMNGTGMRQRMMHTLRRSYYHPKAELLRQAREASIGQNDWITRVLRVGKFQPYPDYDRADSPGWRLLATILQRFIDQTRPIPTLIVPIPDAFYYRADALDPVYQPHFETLASADENVHVADVTARINALPLAERERMPFRHDFHFSPYGNRRFAEILSDEIVQRGMLPKRPGKTFPVHRNGNGRQKAKATYILGISCFYHNSAAALIQDGRLVAAAEEERFTRIKHDRNFPHRAINYCLEEAGIQQNDLAAIVYYDNAYQTFERLMHTQLAIGEEGEDAWLRVMPGWLQQKLTIPAVIRRNLNYHGRVLQEAHHRSHAASAFYPSPFAEAAILTIDGVGEWATASIGMGCGGDVTMLREMRFPHSIGLLYSAFTQFLGFKVNNGEYKMMGLAPYGEPCYVDLILEHLIDLKPDGSLTLNLDYFAFLAEPKMTKDRFAELFEGPARHPDQPITQREMDIARSIQAVTEEVVLRMAQHAHELTGARTLCLAGGVALNCVANGRLLREGPFDDIWIQPAAGDAGCALGAALDVWHTYLGKPRRLEDDQRTLQGGSYWGPDYSPAEIKAFLDTYGYRHQVLKADERAATVAQLIDAGKVVGHFTGRMEYGPRALGSRSILGDARSQAMQTTINLKIKYRESFRPFAPSVLAEAVDTYFELDRESPYMLLVAQVRDERCLPFERTHGQDLFEIVKQPRSDVPAITHVDYSARIQSVAERDHPDYYALIKAFEARTGYGVIVNTSFNVRGEPIVCSPYDAYRCFMRTEMDALILGDYLLLKEEQPAWSEEKGHQEHYDPDARLATAAGPAEHALGQVFWNEFLPIARRLEQEPNARILSEVGEMASAWQPWQSASTLAELFEIAAELDRKDHDPVVMTHALMRHWQPGLVRDALAPVIQRLLEIADQHYRIDEDEDVAEDVSAFVYVMY